MSNPGGPTPPPTPHPAPPPPPPTPVPNPGYPPFHPSNEISDRWYPRDVYVFD